MSETEPTTAYAPLEGDEGPVNGTSTTTPHTPHNHHAAAQHLPHNHAPNDMFDDWTQGITISGEKGSGPGGEFTRGLYEEEEEAPTTCCGMLTHKVRRDVVWASEHSHHMIVIWLCPCLKGHTTQYHMLQCYITYNPLYWMCYLAGLVCILTGRWVHLIVGQGGPVRENELTIEQEVRVHWIYATDGPIMMSLLLDMCELVWFAIQDDLVFAWKDDDDELVVTPAASTLLSALVDIGFIGGNMFFLHSIRMERPLSVKCMIAANFSFACALVVALTYGLASGNMTFEGSDWNKIIGIGLRVTAIVFILTAFYVYRNLWSLYDANERNRGQCDASLILVILVALGIWVIVIVSFKEDSQDMWEALT